MRPRVRLQVLDQPHPQGARRAAQDRLETCGEQKIVEVEMVCESDESDSLECSVRCGSCACGLSLTLCPPLARATLVWCALVWNWCVCETFRKLPTTIIRAHPHARACMYWGRRQRSRAGAALSLFPPKSRSALGLLFLGVLEAASLPYSTIIRREPTHCRARPHLLNSSASPSVQGLVRATSLLHNNHVSLWPTVLGEPRPFPAPVAAGRLRSSPASC